MRFEVVFASRAWQQYTAWQAVDMKTVERINALIEDIQRHPFTGIGKPEPLKHHLAGFWSRRINGEHRLVYRVKENRIEIAQCQYHYS